MSDQHTKYWLTDRAEAALADLPPLDAPVHVGSGKKVWTIIEYWTAPSGDLMAQLIPADGGYTRTSAEVGKLRSVDS